MAVYDKKYIKANVREFNGVIKTNFWGDEIQKEGVYHTCIACITIDSVMKIDKKNYPQVHFEECKYKIKKIKMPEFLVQILNDCNSFTHNPLHRWLLLR